MRHHCSLRMSSSAAPKVVALAMLIAMGETQTAWSQDVEPGFVSRHSQTLNSSPEDSPEAKFFLSNLLKRLDGNPNRFAEGACGALRAEGGLQPEDPPARTPGRSTLLIQEDDMRTFDFSPLYRSAVGFDRMADLLETAAKAAEMNGWPPYNIEQREENAYRVEIAVAGFSAEDLSIEVKEGQLVVSGDKSDRPETEAGRTYLHRGLAQRPFDLRFQLADHVVVKGAELSHGLLSVDLARELPEALKPRRIQISAGGLQHVEHQRDAA